MKNRFLAVVWICIVMLSITSCKRQDGNVIIEGQNLENLGVFRTDTLTLEAKTIREDSLPGNNISYLVLGSMNDPSFGPSRSSIYAKTKIIEPINNFPNTIEPDSALLFIPMVGNNNFYGNRNTIQTLRINPLAESFVSKIYYQTNTLKTNNNVESIYRGPLFKESIDSIGYQKTKIKLPNGILIKLSKEFARHLQQLPAEAYQTTEGLNKHFKGISIIPESTDLPPGEGGVGVFDINNEFSLADRAKILLYYNDTSTFVFGFDGKINSLNHSDCGPFTPEIISELNNPNPQQITYIQSMNGLKTWIRIPYLTNLVAEGNIAVNKAEITFHLQGNSFDTRYYAPPRLNLFQPLNDSNFRNSLTRDGATSGYGGILFEGGNYYKFDITRYIQNILTTQANTGKNIHNGLLLTIPTDAPVTGSRAIIDNSKTKLIITYVKPN